MKVAYIVSRFPKLTETFVLYEMEALKKAGIDVELFPLLKEGEAVTHSEARYWMARAHYMPFVSGKILRAQWEFLWRDPRRYFSVLSEVLRGTARSLNFFVGTLGIFLKTVRFGHEMEELGVEHVHAHFANHPSMAAFIVNRLTGIPFSFTAHGSDLHVIREMLEKKVAEADFVVTISEYNKELIVEECGEQIRDKVKVIHCGVDAEVFEPRKPGFSSPVQLVCVASLHPVKGHRYLIDACRVLKDRGVEFICHVIGDGPLRRSLEKQIQESGLNEAIILHGARPRLEVASMLRQSDIAVLASAPTPKGDREGIPVALMEAMASGLPVVSSKLSGIPELVEDGRSGYLVAPADVTALADALERLCKDAALRREMGTHGRDRVLRDFNLRTNADKLLKEILSMHRCDLHAAA